MKFTVFNTKDADKDIREASLWYEEQQAGLGFIFLNRPPAQMDLISIQELYLF